MQAETATQQTEASAPRPVSDRGTRILRAASPDDVQRLLEDSPWRPFSFCPDFTSAAQLAYLRAVILQAQEKGACTHLIQRRGAPEGLLQMELLPWDSELLGMSVGRITHWLSRGTSLERRNVRRRLLRLALEEARCQPFRYLLVRLPAGDIEGAQLLESRGFQIVDGLVTLGTVPGAEPTNSLGLDGIKWSVASPEDISALCEIAASSFSIDRFHNDPAISKVKADAVHRRWIEDSCAGSADCVLVAHAGGPVGFTTLKLDRLAENVCGVRVGIVTLVATSALFRKRGVARALTHAALSWFHEAGCRWVEVGTQLANLHASRVYQAAGFRPVGASLTFRKLC